MRLNLGQTVTVLLPPFSIFHRAGTTKKPEVSSHAESAWFVWEKPNGRRWVRSTLSTVRPICPSSPRLHPVGMVAWELGRMLGGTSAKEANNSVRGLRRYNGPEGTEPGSPSEQVQPSVCAGPARSAASPRQALGSSTFLVLIGLLVVLWNGHRKPGEGSALGRACFDQPACLGITILARPARWYPPPPHPQSGCIGRQGSHWYGTQALNSGWPGHHFRSSTTGWTV